MTTTNKLSRLLGAVGALAIFGLAAPSDAQSLQKELSDLEVGNHWRYNDWEGAKAAAEKEQKPIFVLFR